MAMSTILKKACMCEQRDFKYPAWVFGKFCGPQSPIVVTKWIPHLVEDLKNAPTFDKKNEAIVALGLLPHEEIIGTLIPYVEGRVQGDYLLFVVQFHEIFVTYKKNRYIF